MVITKNVGKRVIHFLIRIILRSYTDYNIVTMRDTSDKVILIEIELYF
jgi:hypothetical protein